MKIKKLLTLAMLGVMVFTCSAYSAEPEDALSSYYDDSVYLVLKLDSVSGLMKWVLSEDNVHLFLPLIMKDRPKIEVIAMTNVVNTMASMLHKLPVNSAAVIIGISKKDIKSLTPFVQAAFSVKPEFAHLVNKIADGKAEASDIAKLLLGEGVAATLAETTIKVEHEDDNILRVNNDIFMSAYDDLVILGSSVNNVRASKKALTDSETRLFTKIKRRFTEKDFAFLHVDYETAAEFDDDNDSGDIDPRQFFDKPMEWETAFKRTDDRFIMSTAINFRDALKKEFAESIKQLDDLKPVKGGNIDLADAGGDASPLAALGTTLDFESMKASDIWKDMVRRVVRNLRVRFGISEQDTMNFFNGPFSAVVNDTVTFEGFKLPALYLSQAGKKDTAAKIFSTLTKSPHFSKVHDGVLQLDSSLSPISCLVADKGDKLGIYFAELSSLSEKPSVKPVLSDLMERESLASIWVDFAEIQRWLNDDSNGFFATLAPFAMIAGYGQYVTMLRDVLGAEFSVPSMSVWSESLDVFRVEFALKDINVDNGLFAKLIKIYQDLQPAPKTKQPEQEQPKE